VWVLEAAKALDVPSVSSVVVATAIKTKIDIFLAVVFMLTLTHPRKESAKEKGVSIIDSQDIDLFFKLIKKGHKHSAMDRFYKVKSTETILDACDE
jgi:hypothetical protein